MVKLIGMLSKLNPAKVVVVGDLMLDTYTTGKIKRISPEAPVSVLHVEKEESRPGGAGNVVLNLLSLGAEVVTIGRVGRDRAGHMLHQALKEEGASIEGVFFQNSFQTPVKNRLIADSQQLLRVDFEAIEYLPESIEETVIEKLPQLIEGCQMIAISDYGKGFLTRTLLAHILELAKSKNIPVIVDPKGEDFSKYQFANILKPNLSEAYAAAGISQGLPLDRVAAALFEKCQVDQLLITRSEAGMSLFNKQGERFDFPVRSKEVKDVTGAGDTVLAIISIALANGLDIKYAAQLANIAAGIAIERIGCVRIKLSELADRLLELDIENKVFDEKHLFALQHCLKRKQCVLLCLESRLGMSKALFRAVKKLANKDLGQKLVVYIQDTHPDEEFVSLLSSLSEVDFIVYPCKNFKELCEVLLPEKVCYLEQNQLKELNPQASRAVTV